MNVSYYPGCSLHGTAREYGESVKAIAQLLGIEFRELDDWTCCGASSAHVTDDGLAVALPARNLIIADRVGMDLVVPCAACFQRFKVAEKELMAGKEISGIRDKYEGDFHIRYIVDFFWEAVGEKALKKKVKKPLSGLTPVCYYGCLTVRPPNITDAKNPENPQAMDKVIESLGADIKDWSYKTDCCGGSLMFTRPDIAKKLTGKLLDMATEAGANCIVVGCPVCQANLDSRQEEISVDSGKKYEMPVFYFTELMGLAFGDASVKKSLWRHTVDPLSLLEQKGLI
ncbi:CoB--CoM heterodisulfide reductase iron-sulfur subunit B family protein [Chloroflexota bacterium]